MYWCIFTKNKNIWCYLYLSEFDYLKKNIIITRKGTEKKSVLSLWKFFFLVEKSCKSITHPLLLLFWTITERPEDRHCLLYASSLLHRQLQQRHSDRQNKNKQKFVVSSNDTKFDCCCSSTDNNNSNNHNKDNNDPSSAAPSPNESCWGGVATIVIVVVSPHLSDYQATIFVSVRQKYSCWRCLLGITWKRIYMWIYTYAR